MVQHVVDCVGIAGNWIFVVQKEHREKYNLDEILHGIRPDCKIVDTGSGVTEGAACSVLLAKEFIDPDAPLIIINSDNIIDWDTSYYFNMLISNVDATAGIYIWKKGIDFVKSAEQMIEKNIRVNNEFYICPVFNETIGFGKTIKICLVDSMHGVGTPEDLEKYINLIT